MSLKNEVEALLFASGRFMTAEDMSEILDASPKAIEGAVQELSEFYEDFDTALDIQEMNERWKMGVKHDYFEVVQQVVADTELDTPTLETLAVIAWKRPILQSDVVDMRGSGAYDHIKTLMEMEFISRERHGRTYKLKLDEKFYDYFDVEGEQDIRELFADVERPEPEPRQQPNEEQTEIEPPQMEPREDPLEKRKETQEELNQLDEEIDELSKRADEKIGELDELTDEEEGKEE
jgi:segregation and condensation protein B